MVKWIIQKDVFGEETDELIKHAADHHIHYNVIPRQPWYPQGAIVRGTIDFVSRRHGQCLTIDNYRCSRYYQFVPALLNARALWMPWWQLRVKSEFIFRNFYACESLFIRPDEGKKVFTGTTLTKKHWDQELSIIRNLPSSCIQDDTMVLVSGAVDIKRECRVLCHKSRVIGRSAYLGDLHDSDDADIRRIAILNGYYPDFLYTMDLADLGSGRFSVIVELNSFVSAGLYDMDYAKVVPQVEEIWLEQS